MHTGRYQVCLRTCSLIGQFPLLGCEGCTLSGWPVVCMQYFAHTRFHPVLSIIRPQFSFSLSWYIV